MRARFRPLRPPTRFQSARLLILGPLMWLVGLIAVAWVVGHRDAVELGLVITAVSLAAWTVLLLLARWLRVREERRA